MGRKADETKYSEEEVQLWKLLAEQAGKAFHTCHGLAFKYEVRGNELVVNRKLKTVTRASVNMAYKKAKELQVVTGPKKLGVFGSSYLWPVFLELGIIRTM